MKQKFSELEKVLRQVAQAKQDSKKAIAKLNENRKDYSEEYVAIHIEPKIKEAKQNLMATKQEAYEKVANLLGELSDLAVAKSNKLDLNNPAWTNALKLIELSGSGIDGDTIRKINSQFAGDQAAIRALRDVYKAKGVKYDGGLDKQIYQPESAFERLGEWAYNTFNKDGSLNEFASAISKVASMEGIDFPQMIDEIGADNAMRAAAGLPTK